MNAKEMFLNMNYNYFENKDYIEIFEKDDTIFRFDKNCKIISIISIFIDDKCVSTIELNELQAINKQIEELGWNDETTKI